MLQVNQRPVSARISKFGSSLSDSFPAIRIPSRFAVVNFEFAREHSNSVHVLSSAKYAAKYAQCRNVKFIAFHNTKLDFHNTKLDFRNVENLRKRGKKLKTDKSF